MNKKTIFLFFLAMSLVQLYIPANMILEKESILTSGKAFKFKTAPIDPNDPFRGKYIALSFAESSFRIPGPIDMAFGDKIYVQLITDAMGYAKIASVTKEIPVNTEDFVRATLNYVVSDSNSLVQIQYPFDRFYMEESKAPEAERIYNESSLDSSQITYALVYVKKGDAVIHDVIINDVPISEWVKKGRAQPQ